MKREEKTACQKGYNCHWGRLTDDTTFTCQFHRCVVKDISKMTKVPGKHIDTMTQRVFIIPQQSE